jgi:hypothetical protein
MYDKCRVGDLEQLSRFGERHDHLTQSIPTFVLSVSLAAFVIVCRAEEPASGRWEGSVQIPGGELTLIVDLALGPNGTWTGSAIIPGLNVKGKALNDIVVKGAEVSFGITTARGLEATLKGNVSAGGTLAGSFLQAGNTAAFVLKKIGPPQVESSSRNTPISKELDGEWKGQFEIYGMPIKINIKLTSHGNDAGAADFVVVARKSKTLPVDLVNQQGNFVMIESNEAGISYEGTFNAGSGEIKGTYTQATIEVPLVLRRNK